MKTIIAGPRFFGSPQENKSHKKLHEEVMTIFKHCNSCPWLADITQVFSGKAKGVDTVGEWWATAREIPVRPFPANWDLYGLSAGPIRNEEMAKEADGLIVLWDGKSSGTGNMIELADQYELIVHPMRIK